MLEGLVANLLNRFLGMYVKNFDANQLNVGIWSGDVKLRNLELRREALDQLHLPVNVVEGHLGQLTMSIPWTNLRGKPVKVNIEDVFLLAAPKEDAEYNEEEEVKRAHDVKMEKLENVELLKQKSADGQSNEEQQKSQSFVESVTTAVVDNLQVSIKNIHIRYEDAISAPGHPFALGFTLQEFSAVSTDGNWKPSYIQSTSGSAHKLAVLNALAFYWNTETTLFGSGTGEQIGAEAQKKGSTHSEMVQKFKESLESEEGQQYMLKPVSGRAALEIDKTGNYDKPRVKARLLFQELGFILDDEQYRDALMLVDLFHYFLRHQEYKKLEPKSTPKEDPKAWLRFAFKAVHSKIHERERKWSWDYFKERRDDRLRYIELFKKKKKDEKLTPEETAELSKLEQRLSYEDLRFWRSLARSQLRKENVGVKKAPGKKTWSQWAFGSGKQPEQDQSDDTEISEEQRKELYAAIDWDEKKTISESVDVPKESVKLQLESSLRTGSFTLKRDPHGKSNEILAIMFDNFQAKALQRPDSFLADVSLGGMRINDGSVEGSLFPQIVNFKDPTAGAVKQSIEDVAAEDADDPETKKAKEKATEEALFHLVFENNPLDGAADTALMMKIKSLEVIYNPLFVVEVAKFFKPPERHMESIGALMETAGATVEGFRQQTRAGLEFALEEHKTINANLDIQAPLIIVPESITKKSALCLIVDAGHVYVTSELVDKDTMQEVQSKQKKQYTEEDFRQLESLMYDKFKLKLESTQILIGPGIEATKAQLNAKDDPNKYHIIDRINMDFTLELSIIPKSSDLTKTRISGHLPVLHASISDAKYKNLMKLIDVAIPKFDSDESLDGRTKAPTKEKKPAKVDKSRADDVIGRPRAKSSSVPQKELDIDDESDSEQAPKKKKPKRTDTQQVNPQQRNFEFKFTVEKLQGSLYRSDPDGKKADKLLVELIAEHFGFDFYLRPYDMVAEVVLKKLNVDDHIEQDPTPEFKKIVSSEGFEADEKKDLLNVKFVKVNSDSPELDTTYEGIATNLDVAVSTINLVVTRKTLLTLLDFVLITFASPGDTAPPKKAIEESDKASKDIAVPEADTPKSADKIRIKAVLQSVSLILNNDGIRLATLSLNSADVGLLLSGASMNVAAKLGNLSLVDDINLGADANSSLRKLISIEGDELADFKFQTFDKQDKSYPGFDSKVSLRSGSIKVNFLEEPFRKIINFLVKFGQMQAIYNAARQAAANQASQIQESTSKFKFDILIKTPILVFPRAMVSERPRDSLIANLGEIYASNKFAKLGESGVEGNKISAGIRNVRLTSVFHYDDDQTEELEMIDKGDLEFKIIQAEHQEGSKRPDTEIQGKLSPINLKIAQTQIAFLMEVAETVPRAFATDSEQTEEEAMAELPRSMTDPAQELSKKSANNESAPPTPTTSQNPEIEPASNTWTKLDLVFDAPTIALELILATEDEPVEDVKAASLSKFAINDTKVKLRMKTDDSMESELNINSFTISDSRQRETNKFRKIMSLINDDVKQQFMASVTMTGGKDRHLIAMLTIDSPRVIMAIDYLLAVQAFLNSALKSPQPAEPEESLQAKLGEDESEGIATTPTSSRGPSPEKESTDDQKGGMSMSFRVNIVDAQVILIANPTINNSEAIVLGTKQVLVSQQNASTLQISKVGMFLCRMDRFDTSRLRILDDFSITMSMDSRNKGKQTTLTSVSIDIEPLVLRLALRDILLALQIVNKASEMSNEISGTADTPEDTAPAKLKDLQGKTLKSTKRGSTIAKKGSNHAPHSTKSAVTKKSSSKPPLPQRQGSILMKREEMTATIEGIRVVLIGDLHELPMFDWSVKKFNVDVRDWSASMTADASFDTYLNVYNFSKSAWEPLIEPWQLGLHVAKEQHPDLFTIDVYSHKVLELTMTSATIALASKASQFLATEEDVLAKPRGNESPYKIRNHTGFELSVWAASKEEDQGSAAKLADGEEAPWRFEDPSQMRENLTPEGNSGIVGIKLEGSGFDTIEKINVNREGEFLHNLKPRKDNVQHRLMIEVELATDNVKYITFRSPLLVENKTHIPLEIGVFSPEEGHLLKIEKISPGEARPAPVGAAFMHSLVVRPDQGFGYAWSNERLFWKDLLKRPVRTLSCKGENDSQSPPFYFQLNASYDKNNPMTSVYPYMRIKIHAPIEVQNLLPYDFKYRIYDRHTKKDWTNFLRKGGVSPVHVVELSHLLLLSVDVQDTQYKASDFAVINSGHDQDVRREKDFVLKDPHGSNLRLKVHYFNHPDSGGAFKVSVFAPYLVLNKTGLNLNVQSKSGFSRGASGHGLQMDSESATKKALPYMFSYNTDDQKNRALVKIADSAWSKAQSFEALGSTYEVGLASQNNKTEMHVGVSVSEGEGKYNLTKVVTIAPRYIVKNKTNQDLDIREPGSSNVISLKKGDLLPLNFMRQVPDKQLCLCWPGVNNQWSSPFFISNVGTVHVKLAKAQQRQQLIRVEIIMEAATIFLHITVETKQWPYTMRNESDMEFMFYQVNPALGEDEEDKNSGWKPIRYRLPAKSIMPYAWDYPASKNKELILIANGKERRLKLAEIGNLVPLKVPPPAAGRPPKIIDLNIVADGPTQTLVMSNYKQSKSMYKQRSNTAASTSSLATNFEVKEMESDVTFKANLRLAGFGVSLVNRQLKELLYLTLRDIELKYGDSKLYQTLGLTIKWIQIDNQLYGGIFPILLYPSVVPKTGKEMEAHPIFHSMVTRVKDDSYGVLYIKYFTLLLQQMTVELDEDFIFAMLDFAKIPGASWADDAVDKLCDEDLSIPEPQTEQQGQDVYFEFFHLQPMQIDLSFVRTERVNAEDTATSSNPFMFFVNVMTMSVGNVNDAPLRLNALMLENARISIPSLATNIQSHYTQEVLRQVHIVLGSADFLGNPVGLFNNVSSGVADIFYEPYQGLVMTDRPQELGIGIAKGASSFVKKSVFGFSDSMAKITGSMSKGLAAATMDKEFQDQRRMSKSRNRPKHALYGVTSGGNAFASSLASGIGGLARHPLQGAEKEGVSGFMKGVGKGLLGVPTKAAIGAFDLASSTYPTPPLNFVGAQLMMTRYGRRCPQYHHRLRRRRPRPRPPDPLHRPRRHRPPLQPTRSTRPILAQDTRRRQVLRRGLHCAPRTAGQGCHGHADIQSDLACADQAAEE